MLKNKYQFIVWVFCVFCTLCACNKLEDENLNGRGKEGEPAKTYIRLKDPGMSPATKGLELTEEEERTIKSLFLFVFDESGDLVSSTEHVDVTLHASSGGTTWNPLPLYTTIGDDRRIYAVANYNLQVIENIKSVASLEDLTNLMVQNMGNPLSPEYGIIKVGVATVNVRNGGEYDIVLKNLVAKVTIQVVNKCPDAFQVSGWTIDGFSLKSYVVERVLNPDNLNYHDAPNVNDENDFYNNFTNQVFPFEPGGTTPEEGALSYSITGYCYENRRGGRVTREEPPIGWPNGDENDGMRKEYQLKTWYAPQNATRVRIFGKNAATQKQIIINHYLGNNNYDDYNVERGKHYTYTITVNNLNDIDIDTNVEQYGNKLTVYSSPDLTALDAHPSTRVFQLHTNELSSGKVSFEVLANKNTTSVRPDWLKIAVFPLVNYQVKGGGGYGGDAIAPWQQDGIQPGYYARSKFIPHQSVRARLSGYTPPAGVVLGDDNSEYPANDDVLPFNKAIRRMCYKITDIPVGSASDAQGGTSLFIYADEFGFDPLTSAPDSREAVVRITFTPDGGTAEDLYYNIRQYRPVLFTGLPGEANPMLLERSEDYNTLLLRVTPLEQQLLNGLQWGTPVSGEVDQALDKGNGYLNTAQAVYTNVVAVGNGGYTWSLERTKFGSNTGGWVGTNGAIKQPVDNSVITGAPWFMFNFSTKDAYNTVFNTTAARYCHEKNFDINGDGIISPEETFWYLPSEQELQLLWTYNEILNLSPSFYWSSTLPAAGAEGAYAISMQRSPADANITYNGVPQTRPRTGYSQQKPPRVRCVRRTEGRIAALSPMVTHTIEGRSVVDCSNLSGDMYTVVSKMGISQKDAGALQSTNTKVYKKLEVQRNSNPPVTYSELIQGTGKCDESKGWRLPTQRELLLIWSVRDKLEKENAFETFQADDYWTMMRVPAGNYMVDFITGLALFKNPDASQKHSYRCVREL